MKREALLDSAVSEIEYSIKTKHTKSEEVHEHYLRNAIRFIQEAKEVNERGGGMKKCKVIINENKETIEANFYGVFQKAWGHGKYSTTGDYTPGQVAYPVAVVDWGEGLTEVNVADVVEVAE